MKKISDRCENLSESGIRRIQELAGNMEGVIHLEIGEPNYVTPSYICRAASKAMDDGFTRYTNIMGFDSLREAIADDINSRIQTKLNKKQIVVTAGGVMAVFGALMVLADAGDEILIPDPAWPNYEMQCEELGLKCVRYLLNESRGFTPDFTELEVLVTPKTKCIIVNSPGNPAGNVFSEKVLRRILDFAEKYDLYIISDEIYDYLTYEEPYVSLKSFDKDGRVVLVSGFSKKYAMTGWRIGFAAGDEKIISKIGQTMIGYASNCNSIAQKAAEAALIGPQDFVKETIQSYKKRRDKVAKLFEQYNIPFFMPQGAFYMWIDISNSGMDGQSFAVKLLEQERVAVVPGDTFGDSGAYKIRISLATEESELLEAAKRIIHCIRN